MGEAAGLARVAQGGQERLVHAIISSGSSGGGLRQAAAIRALAGHRVGTPAAAAAVAARRGRVAPIALHAAGIGGGITVIKYKVAMLIHLAQQVLELRQACTCQ